MHRIFGSRYPEGVAEDALVLLGEGRVTAAEAELHQALVTVGTDPLARSRLLPAVVGIAVAAGDVETARSAAVELRSVADTYSKAGLAALAGALRASAVKNAERFTARTSQRGSPRVPPRRTRAHPDAPWARRHRSPTRARPGAAARAPRTQPARKTPHYANHSAFEERHAGKTCSKAEHSAFRRSKHGVICRAERTESRRADPHHVDPPAARCVPLACQRRCRAGARSLPSEPLLLLAGHRPGSGGQRDRHPRSHLDRHLSPRRAVHAAALVAAFSSDPILRWVFPDAGRYLSTFPQLVEVMGRDAFLTGTVEVAGSGAGTVLPRAADAEAGKRVWLRPDALVDDAALVELSAATVDPPRFDAVVGLLDRWTSTIRWARSGTCRSSASILRTKGAGTARRCSLAG